MTQVTIKIELNNLDKALVEVKALETYIKELAKTYPTTFATVTEEEKPKTPRKRTRTAKKEPEATKKVPEPTKEPEKPSETILSLSEMTELAKQAVAKVGRDIVREIVAKYGTGRISSIDEKDYKDLEKELKELLND